MPRVAKSVISGGCAKVVRSASASSANTCDAMKGKVKEKFNHIKPVTGKPSMTRDFEWNLCKQKDKIQDQDQASSHSPAITFENVIGCDEAGRGPLCGPVVAAAAWVSRDATIEHGILDSKATTEREREATYEILVNHPGVKYSVVRIEHDEIDEINILQASLKAMRLACTNVLEQLQDVMSVDPATCLCLVDGNKCPQDMPITTKCVIKGDSLAFSIATASIIAKITRDRIMTAYAEQYPLYGLEQHKGYPTLAHRSVLKRHGPSPIHRMSYRPVYESVKGYVKLPDKTKANTKAKIVTKASAKTKTKTKTPDKKKKNSSSNNDKTDPTQTKTTKTTSIMSTQGVLASGRVTRSSSRKRKEMDIEGVSPNISAIDIFSDSAKTKKGKVK